LALKFKEMANANNNFAMLKRQVMNLYHYDYNY
jgi:hypothetical protein